MEPSRLGPLSRITLGVMCTIWPILADAEQTLVVDFSTGTLRVVAMDGTERFITPVVLPRGNYYPVPVSGTVRRAELGPIWIPTARMHQDNPGKYKPRYGPYESGNAMGHCKISIDFKSSHPLMTYVRVHGNAKPADLGQRRSRSCIRIPDKVCRDLVGVIDGRLTLVQFIK